MDTRDYLALRTSSREERLSEYRKIIHRGQGFLTLFEGLIRSLDLASRARTGQEAATAGASSIKGKGSSEEAGEEDSWIAKDNGWTTTETQGASEETEEEKR